MDHEGLREITRPFLLRYHAPRGGAMRRSVMYLLPFAGAAAYAQSPPDPTAFRNSLRIGHIVATEPALWSTKLDAFIASLPPRAR
jgi:hypothetical protein